MVHRHACREDFPSSVSSFRWLWLLSSWKTEELSYLEYFWPLISKHKIYSCMFSTVRKAGRPVSWGFDFCPLFVFNFFLFFVLFCLFLFVWCFLKQGSCSPGGPGTLHQADLGFRTLLAFASWVLKLMHTLPWFPILRFVCQIIVVLIHWFSLNLMSLF